MGRLLASVVCYLTFLSTALPATVPPLPTSEHATRKNAFQIFNAVHSAMRQWGSSLNHNGMSFLLATVPEGQLLYHGSWNPGRKKGFDWLAFEVEHAQGFAQSWDPDSPDVHLPPLPPCEGPSDGEPPSGGFLPGLILEEYEWGPQAFFSSKEPALSSQLLRYNQEQRPMAANEGDNKDKPCVPPYLLKRFRGYFHTYRAARPLRLLYLDGMAAGKVRYGTLDTQDLVLLDWPANVTQSDSQRAAKLCAMAEDWAWEDKDGGKIDGFVRMEAGFEIMYCDFAEGAGLELVNVQGSPFWNETGASSLGDQLGEWLRGVAMRNHGLPSGRIEVDWSSMVSTFFYDVNLTNPDASRPELPRLVRATKDERKSIKARVREVIAARHGQSDIIDWQSVVDLIVTRYSDRLAMLANMTAEISGPVVNAMMNPYIDYGDTEPFAHLLERCTRHYIESTILLESSWTPEDRLLYTAVETVTRDICSSFLQLRSILSNSTDEVRGRIDTKGDTKGNTEEVSEKVRKVASSLMSKLQWTTWKECEKCSSPDKFCFVAMFPFGSVEDHFSPSCKNRDGALRSQNYWILGM